MKEIFSILEDIATTRKFKAGENFFLPVPVRMEIFAFRSIRERLAFTLIDILERQTARGESTYSLDLKRQGLDGMVGASRESISRTLSDFEIKGVVSTHRGGLVILDQEKLKLISG